MSSMLYSMVGNVCMQKIDDGVTGEQRSRRCGLVLVQRYKLWLCAPREVPGLELRRVKQIMLYQTM